jgi:hypothetical protein
LGEQAGGGCGGEGADEASACPVVHGLVRFGLYSILRGCGLGVGCGNLSPCECSGQYSFARLRDEALDVFGDSAETSVWASRLVPRRALY